MGAGLKPGPTRRFGEGLFEAPPWPRPRRHASRLDCSLAVRGFAPGSGPRWPPGCGVGLSPGPHICQQLGRACVPGLPGGRAPSAQIRIRQLGAGGWDPDGQEGVGAEQPRTTDPDRLEGTHPGYREPPAHPYLDQLQIVGPLESPEALTWAPGWGRKQAKEAGACLAGAPSQELSPSDAAAPHIPRYSLTDSTSTCGTGAWSSSP